MRARSRLAERPLVVIRRLAQLDPGQPQAERGGGALRRLPLVGRQPVPEHGRGRHVRKCVFDELNPLRRQLDLLKEHAGDVAGGARQIGHVAVSERIVVDGDHHDGQRPGGGERRLQGDFRAGGQDDIRFARRERPVAGFVLLFVRGRYEIKDEILSFLITELSHPPHESGPLRRGLLDGGDSADTQHLLGRLLRVRR